MVIVKIQDINIFKVLWKCYLHSKCSLIISCGYYLPENYEVIQIIVKMLRRVGLKILMKNGEKCQQHSANTDSEICEIVEQSHQGWGGTSVV